MSGFPSKTLRKDFSTFTLLNQEQLDHAVRYLSTWSGSEWALLSMLVRCSKLTNLQQVLHGTCITTMKKEYETYGITQTIQYALKIIIPFLDLRARLRYKMGTKPSAANTASKSLSKLYELISDSRMLWRFWGMLQNYKTHKLQLILFVQVSFLSSNGWPRSSVRLPLPPLCITSSGYKDGLCSSTTHWSTFTISDRKISSQAHSTSVFHSSRPTPRDSTLWSSHYGLPALGCSTFSFSSPIWKKTQSSWKHVLVWCQRPREMRRRLRRLILHGVGIPYGVSYSRTLGTYRFLFIGTWYWS